MGLRGNVAALVQLRSRIESLRAPVFRENLSKRLGAAAMKLVADEFRRSQNPYGAAWAPLKRQRRRQGRRKGRADKPLMDTGRLRAAFAAADALQAGPWGFSIVVPVEYASYHQYGTRRMPQRQMLPMVDTGGLGPIWSTALLAEADRAVRDWAKERR